MLSTAANHYVLREECWTESIARLIAATTLLPRLW
jgi:hypothetical protein